MNTQKNIFWFRRDLRLDDNHALYHAMLNPLPLRFVFIFDTEIIKQFDPNDIRFSFIFNRLVDINRQLNRYGFYLETYEGKPADIFQKIIDTSNIRTVYANEDYEPYARQRDETVATILKNRGVDFELFTDHVIFHPSTIIKTDNRPYTVFTPFSRRWLALFDENRPTPYKTIKLLTSKKNNNIVLNTAIIPPQSLIIGSNNLKDDYPTVDSLHTYAEIRNIPHLDATTKVSTLLRFGIISFRRLTLLAYENSKVYLNELIWREFYFYILYHFPQMVNRSFKIKFDNLPWNRNEEDFVRWCNGETGYPLVDAGMRQLNATGFMHNRVRMVVASFLTKHLLIDWRWGEAYFAQKLHDFEQSSNVGNWQWAASTGNDPVPYFRIFNPDLQTKRFDPHYLYIKQWVPEYDKPTYPKKIIDHEFARQRALEVYGQISKRQ